MILRDFYPLATPRRRTVSGLALLLVVALAAVFVATSSDSADGPPAFRGAMQEFQPSARAEAAPAVNFTDIDGKPLTLADFRGRVVLLNFWATWCGPCVEEMPSLDRLQAKLGGDRFAIVAVSVDREGLSIVKPFLERLHVANLATYLDPRGASMRAFGVRGLPTSVIIDRDGKAVGRLEGMASWDSASAEKLLRHYLGPANAPLQRADAR
jgi:thiol-disulfide isomerase/thioredoxin